jgi:hypothetical protein
MQHPNVDGRGAATVQCIVTMRGCSARFNNREIKIFIRAVYYVLNSIARRTSLEIREFTLPGPGPFRQAQDRRGILEYSLWNTKVRINECRSGN